MIAETDSTNTVAVEYIFGDDLLAQNRSGTLSNYQYDGLGSTRVLSDSTGNVSDEYFYDAFGVELARTGNTENDYLFTGEQYDAGLGNYYLRARYYDQGVGRFTQQDTWMGRVGEPITLNKYVYANSDAVNYTDPTGNFAGGLTEQAAANNVLGMLATMSIVKYVVFGGTSIVDKPAQTLTSRDIGILALGESGRKLENLLSSKRDKRRRDYVAKPAELVGGKIVIYPKKLSFIAAVLAAKSGGSLMAKSKDWAFKIAFVGSGGRHPGPAEIHGSGKGYRYHYHLKPRTPRGIADAHIWF